MANINQGQFESDLVVRSFNILNEDVDFDLKRILLQHYILTTGFVVSSAKDFYSDESIHCAISSVDNLIGFILPQIYMTKHKSTKTKENKIKEQERLMELQLELRQAKLDLLNSNDFKQKVKLHSKCQEVLTLISKKFILFGMFIPRPESVQL